MRRPLNPWQYRWSSHRAYLGEREPVQVNAARVLERFHRQLGAAWKSYRRFLKEGLAQGHEEKFYETVDQRFLGDERFIQEVDRRTSSRREIVVGPSRVPFGLLLRGVAQLHGVPPPALVTAGRRRALVPARAMLVYWARTWGRLTTQELGKRLHRDPSMISRLYAAYAMQRDLRREAQLKGLLSQ